MEAFLLKGSSTTPRTDPVRGDKAAAATLLYNPQPRQRFVFPNHNDNKHGSERKKGPPLGGGGASGYKQYRSSKLLEQAPKEASKLFTGMSFYFNGRSGDKQTMHLKGAVSKHGGRTTPFMSMKGVTHVIAENLSAVKTDKAMKSLKMKVVHPDWLNRCIAEGKLLSDVPFRVVHSQKLGMGNFFGSSASSSTPASASNGQRNSNQKENKKEETPKRRRSSLGRSSSSGLSISREARHEEDRRGSRSRGRGLEGAQGSGSCVAGPARAAAVKSSNGHGDSKSCGRNVGLSTSKDTSQSRESSKKRARTSSSCAGDGIRSQCSTSMYERVDRKERESDARIRDEAK